jgi:hypothetical protein
MTSFSLDIERFYKELAEKGQQLKGIFRIQYPIYCIHANINDVTPDPLDNLDKAITSFYLVKPDITSFQIGCLMGTSKALIDHRINKLIQDGLLEKEKNKYKLTPIGIDVFKEKTIIRQHKRSYDFFLDGITFKPLPRIFYTYYRSKFIREDDSYIYTNLRGETKIARPFGPDIVHTPPNKSEIIEAITNIQAEEREIFSIPKGLVSIEDIAFSKLTFQLLVAVSSTENEMIKEIIDGFAIHSLAENVTYYDTLKKYIGIFEDTLNKKIANLEFKISIPRLREDRHEQPKPILLSNWPEIDKYKGSQNKCFSFSSEDLMKVIDQIFEIKHVVPESIVNNDTSVEISIDRKMLLDSPNRQKLVNDLIRARDYKFGDSTNNIFILYLYYKTNDDFVKEVIKSRLIICELKNLSKVDLKWASSIQKEFDYNYRELLIAGGEYELLERLDVEKHMVEIN